MIAAILRGGLSHAGWFGVADLLQPRYRGVEQKEPSLHGYLAHKKPPLPMTLQKNYAQGPMGALGGGAVSDERGTPVRVGVYHESRRCSRDTYPESYAAKYTSIRR